MLTYQDLLKVGPEEEARMAFARRVIEWHCSTDLYKDAVLANEYYCGRNRTILEYEKTLVNTLGQVIPDRWSPNHKATSNFFNIFVTQLSQYLLANGPTWGNQTRYVPEGTTDAVAMQEWSDEAGAYETVWKLPGTDMKLGDDFDTRLAEAGKQALIGGVSFGFWDSKKLNVFPVTQFAPLFDEETGALSAGVRFWRLDKEHPLRATLYELDGFTDYIWDFSTDAAGNRSATEEGKVFHAKRAYIIIKTGDAKDREDGTEIIEGRNFPSFPIVPLWGNPQHVSELASMREKIDAYDLILNGYTNDLDSAQLYWIIKGAEGMQQEDLRVFLQQLMTSRIANPGDGQEVQAVTVNIPFEARQTLLSALETRLYKDAQALDPTTISSGAATATQIRAAYEPLNTKTDQFEYCVIDFLQGILAIAGIEDRPSFVRSMVMNVQEEIQSLVMAGDYLSSAYITRRILTVLGDGDQADAVLQELDDQRAAQETDNAGSEDMEAFYADVEETLNGFLGGDSDGRDSGAETAPVSA